jgi:O-antigen/teichoic acid export membrane protein
MAGVTTRVARGGIWSLAGQFLAVGASFVATPFVIRLLGTEAYGVLALVNLVIGYLSFADAGMGEASTRLASAAHARGDDAAESAAIWTTLVIALVPTLLGATALVVSAPILVTRVFHFPATLQGSGIAALRIAALGFVGRNLAGVLNTPQTVRLRLDLCTVINSGFGVAQIALVPIVLAAGGGLPGAVWVITLAACGTALAHAIVALDLLPQLARPRLRWSLVAGAAAFGAAVAASSLLNIALTSSEKVILTWFGSVKALAYYSVALTFAGFLSIVPTALGQGLMPAFAQLGSLDDRGALQQLYARALRATMFWTAPVTMMMCVIARPFFTLWAGAEFGRESTLPFYILLGGLVFNVVAFIPYRLMTAQGRAGFTARYHALELIPYLACTGALTYWFGARGAAAAWSLRQVVAAVVFLSAVSRLEHLKPVALGSNRSSFALALLMLIIPGALAFAAESIVVRGAIALAAVLGYAAVIWTRVLSDEERTWMSGILHPRGLLTGAAQSGVA